MVVEVVGVVWTVEVLVLVRDVGGADPAKVLKQSKRINKGFKKTENSLFEEWRPFERVSTRGCAGMC